MSRLDLPDAFNQQSQDKVKGLIVKMPKPPKSALVESMKELAKRHAGIDWDLFGTDKLITAHDIEARSAAVESAVKDKIGKLTAQAGDVNHEVDDLAKAAGKDAPKDLTALLQKIKGAMRPYTTQVDAICDAARADLKARLAKAKADDKKGAAPAAPSKVESKAVKMIRQRGLEVLRKVRKPAPNAKPSRFMIVEFKKVVRVYMGPSAGPAQEKMLRGLMPEKPVKIYKDPASEIVWEQNALTLVSDRIPSGLAKKVLAALKIQLKMSIKVRMRKTSGPAEEAVDSDAKELTDDMLKADEADKKEAEKAGREFAAKLAKLKPQIDKAMKSYDPEDKKALADLIASIKKNGDAKNYDDAASDLEDIEAMLDETPSGDKDEDDGLTDAEISKLHDSWVSVRGDALRDIKAVAEAVVKLVRASGGGAPDALPKAVNLLKGCMTEFQNDLDKQLAALLAEKDSAKRAQKAKEVKAAAVKLRQYVEQNAVMQELDNNEVLKVQVSAPVKAVLENVEAVLR